MSKKKTFNEFIKEYIAKHGILKYDFVESTFKDSHTPMKIICPKHGEFWKSPKNILRYDCIKCSYELRAKKNKLTTDEFLRKAKLVHGNKYDYSKVVYNGTKKTIIINCPIHGDFLQKPNDHLSGKGCMLCNESHLERQVKQILIENNIDYIYQYKTEWLGKQSLDFYLPNYNIAIECQGKQHFGIGGWSTKFNFKNLLELDVRKYNLTIENNIKLIYVAEQNLINTDIEIYQNNIFSIKDLISCILQKK